MCVLNPFLIKKCCFLFYDVSIYVLVYLINFVAFLCSNEMKLRHLCCFFRKLDIIMSSPVKVSKSRKLLITFVNANANMIIFVLLH